MTPKEKAEELVNKYWSVYLSWDKKNNKPNTNLAKQYALLVCDEILLYIKLQIGYYDEKGYEYWNEVRTVLNAL